MRNLLWQSEAWKEYESLQAEKATLKKVNKLLKDIMGNKILDDGINRIPDYQYRIRVSDD